MKFITNNKKILSKKIEIFNNYKKINMKINVNNFKIL